MGGGGSSQTQQNQQVIASQQEQTMQQYLQLAQTQFQENTQLQAPAINYLEGIIGATGTGNYGSILSAAGLPISQISQAGQQSQANIMNTVAPGAARDYALASNARQTPTSEAQAVSSIYSSAFPTLASLGTQAAQLGLGQTTAGISSGNSSANTYAQVGQEQNQAKASTLGFFGELAGAAGQGAGLAASGCWIAEAIYGADDWRTLMIRPWLNGPFRDTFFGRVVMAFYYRFGFSFASVVRSSASLKKMLKPLFDAALHRAMRHRVETDTCCWLNL